MCALLGLSAQSVNAQDARLSRRLDVATTSAVNAIIDSSRVMGLPAEPLVQKALEGVSKGASAGMVVAAVRSLALRLREAHEALESASGSELVAAAAALDAGARPDDLRKWRGLAAGERLTTALIGCTYLMQRGVAADNAFGIVQTMLDAKLSGADFATLQRLVDQDIRAGAPAAEAARLRVNALILQRGRVRGEGGE
jgi:hypothetical protein